MRVLERDRQKRERERVSVRDNWDVDVSVIGKDWGAHAHETKKHRGPEGWGSPRGRTELVQPLRKGRSWALSGRL